MRTLVIVALVASSLEVAGADTPAARALYADGQRHYQAGEYSRAARLFMRAYRQEPRAALLFNAAQAYRLAGACSEARIAYRDYLIAEPRGVGRGVVRAYIARMDRCASSSRQTSAVARSGDARPKNRAVAIGAAGLALLATSGILAWDSARASGRLSDRFESGGELTQSDADDARRGRRSDRLAWIAGSAGIAAVAAGVVLFVRADRSAPSALRASLNSRGAVVGWSWQL